MMRSMPSMKTPCQLLAQFPSSFLHIWALMLSRYRAACEISVSAPPADFACACSLDLEQCRPRGLHKQLQHRSSLVFYKHSVSLICRLSRDTYHKGAKAWVMLLQELAHGAQPAACLPTEPDLESDPGPSEGYSDL